MSVRALSDVLLGLSPPARAGDILPATYLDMEGAPVPVDFERLLDAGLAEKVDKVDKVDKAPRKASG